MKNRCLFLLTFLFLVIIAPTLMFAMIAPHLTGTILLVWCIFVLIFGALGYSMQRHGRRQTGSAP